MSELHEIDGIIFGGEKYTVGASGEVPEGLIDPMAIEWVVSPGYSTGVLRTISPVGIPVKLPDIESKGNYITTINTSDFGPIAKVLSGVILPSHLVEVPGSLFSGGQLKFVEFGDHLTTIGSLAFDNNQLTSLYLPDSLTSIGNYAFESNQITSLDLPDSVASIGTRTFDENPLEEVSIHIDTTYNSNSFPSGTVISHRVPEGHLFGEGLTSIGFSAYTDKGLTGEITIADGVINIGNDAFRDNQLTSLDLPESLTTIGEFAFRDNQLTSLDLPDSLETIGNYALGGNQLTSVVFPESLTSIGYDAFRDNQLTSVVFPDSLTSVGSTAFDENPLEEVSIHIGTTYYSGSFPFGTKINHRVPEGYAFGEGLTSISSEAFKNKGLTGEITIADGVINIGNDAFRDNQLTSVVFPDSLTSIGFSTFQNNQITSLDLPDSVTSIEGSAFSGNQLTSVVIPDSVTSIGGFAFWSNPLTEVSIGPNTIYDESYSFPDSAVITVRGA